MCCIPQKSYCLYLSMELIRLKEDTDIKSFDCGDADLNDFILNDAKAFLSKKIANTFLVVDNDKVVAYFSLLNDKVSKTDAAKNTWRKLKGKFPHEKHFSSYPAIKIGRFAVSLDYRNQGMGSQIMAYIKTLLIHKDSYSAFRFLTVDAYISAIPFYEKNGFKTLLPEEDDEHTRTMYFDMITV